MPDDRDPDPVIRRCQRVLLMVHELHKRGYQLLRIVPGLNASGSAWRCGITSRNNILRKHGALACDWSKMANYSSAEGNQYFGWEDCQSDTARQLADKFVARFPELIASSEGLDWNYCGWYVQMLGFADRRALPIAYADDLDESLLSRGILSTGPEFTNSLPLPPPGEVDA